MYLEANKSTRPSNDINFAYFHFGFCILDTVVCCIHRSNVHICPNVDMDIFCFPFHNIYDDVRLHSKPMTNNKEIMSHTTNSHSMSSLVLICKASFSKSWKNENFYLEHWVYLSRPESMT